MFKLALVASACFSAAFGSTIDSGFVLTYPFFVPDGTTATLINLTSADGHFSLSSPGIVGGGNLPCVRDSPSCPFEYGAKRVWEGPCSWTRQFPGSDWWAFMYASHLPADFRLIPVPTAGR